MTELVHLIQEVLIVCQIVVNFLHRHIFTQLDIRPEAVDIPSHQINLPLLLLDYKLVTIIRDILEEGEGVREGEGRDCNERSSDLRGCMWVQHIV
jgi:hypothetical protein